jgi:Putative metallopeptidase
MIRRCFTQKTLPSWSVSSQTALVRHETEYKLPSNSSVPNGEARGHTREQFMDYNGSLEDGLRSQAMQLPRRIVAFVTAFLLSVVVGTPCSGGDSTPAQVKGKGRMTIVYQDDAVQPANRDVIKKIKDSGVFERMADRLTKAVALPHDLQVVVTDKLPKGFDDPTTETDGGKIWWPAAFSKATHDILTEFLPEVIASKGPPRAISKENFTPDVLNVWGNQFILGHELGHALIRQLNVPLTGMEEDSADGFATFFTVNDKDTGPNAALGAAVLFDAMGSKRPNLTIEDFSSDHPVIMQRVYNFLCAVVGSDPQRLQNPLVTDGYIPTTRGLLCRKEWTQLNYGWWTLLEPHLTDSSKNETKAVRQQARKDLEDENKALPAKIRQVRGG